MSGNTSETRCKHCQKRIEFVGNYWRSIVSPELLCPINPNGRHEPTPPEGEAVPEQPNRAHFSLSPAEAHETVAGKENLTMKNFVIAFHVCCETKEQAHQWRMSALQILDQNTHALGYKPDETGDLNCHCSGHADEENGEEEIPLIPAPVVSTAAPEPECPICGKVECMTGLPDTTPAQELGQHFAKIHMREQEEADSLRVTKSAEGEKCGVPLGSSGYLEVYCNENKPCPKHAPVAPESYKPTEGERKGILFSDKGIEICKEIVARELEKNPEYFKAACAILGLQYELPAATPVTVEAPGNNPWHLFHRLWTKAVGTDGYIKQEWRDLEAVMVRAKIGQNWATPKRIGDVEAVARQIVKQYLSSTDPCDPATVAAAQVAGIAAILSPFFATPSDKWYMEYQAAVTRAVQAELECATLRKERDEARSELDQWTKWGVVEVAVRNPQVADYCEHWEGRAEAAEAQLSTLRALDVNGIAETIAHEVCDETPKMHGNLPCWPGTHIIAEKVKQHFRAALAPTPEVAKE